MVHGVLFWRAVLKKEFLGVHLYYVYKMANGLKIIKKALSYLSFISLQWIDKSFQEVPNFLHVQLGDFHMAMACTGGSQFYT